MKRWIIYKNNYKQGQASTWHGALKHATVGYDQFMVIFITKEYIRVDLIGEDMPIYIKYENIK